MSLPSINGMISAQPKVQNIGNFRTQGNYGPQGKFGPQGQQKGGW